MLELAKGRVGVIAPSLECSSFNKVALVIKLPYLSKGAFEFHERGELTKVSCL